MKHTAIGYHGALVYPKSEKSKH
ncbi:uncharacterized protein METZ01_LOCUS238123 [marine metagenome]|uniref:Uncharacterized protein n=1 Tax=marine metagenome TaxID=408172 RepID=A0A382HDP0_9ZZZZ